MDCNATMDPILHGHVDFALAKRTCRKFTNSQIKRKASSKIGIKNSCPKTTVIFYYFPLFLCLRVENDDEEDNYLQFVKNYMLDQNDMLFESTRLKCRELDPKGSFFYKLSNKNYTFRVCDACKELPIRKINAIRIDEPAIVTLNSTEFPQCFGACFDNKMCVAYSFNKNDGQCRLFDTNDGEYVDDAYDWQTIVIPQPVDVLRDFTYSRNTMIKCVENSTEIHSANSILDCFALCEKINCSSAEFSPIGSCITVNDHENCSTASYKYGHTSLFYRDYFSDGISWRFDVSDDNDDDDDFYDELPEAR